MKAQSIRLMDVFLLGPFMIWFGFVAQSISTIPKIIMIISGAGTIIYNGRNYLLKRKKKK